VLGERYIEDAFRWARAADPDVLLYYNEVAIERAGPKSDFTYRLLADLLSRGVPIDGIGLQSHVSSHRYPSEHDLRANIQRFGALGLRVTLSEVDVRTKLLPGDEPSRLWAQRVAYQQLVGACTLEPACEGVTFWGFTDNYSWINDEGPEDPLLFDRNYLLKPAYEGVVAGLQGRLPIAGSNLIANGNFAGGTEGWSADGAAITLSTDPTTGSATACVAERAQATAGLFAGGLLPGLGAAGPLAFSARVRTGPADAASTVDAVLRLEYAEAASEEVNIATRLVEPDQWVDLTGYLAVGFNGTPSAVGLVLNGPAAGVELCTSDVALAPLHVE
jgi:hypothetical protein